MRSSIRTSIKMPFCSPIFINVSMFSERMQSSTNVTRSKWCWRSFVLSLVYLLPIFLPDSISNSSTKIIPSLRSVCSVATGGRPPVFSFQFSQRRNVRASWAMSFFAVLPVLCNAVLITVIKYSNMSIDLRLCWRQRINQFTSAYHLQHNDRLILIERKKHA